MFFCAFFLAKRNQCDLTPKIPSSKDSYVLLRQANITHHIGHSENFPWLWAWFGQIDGLILIATMVLGPRFLMFFWFYKPREYWFVKGIINHNEIGVVFTNLATGLKLGGPTWYNFNGGERNQKPN